MNLRSWSVLAIVVAGPALLAAQGPVFRAQANYVEVDAIVADRTGAFVPGLTAADFEVREGRALQSIGAFSAIDIARSGSALAANAAAPVRFRGDVPASLRIDATRIYLLYLNAVPPDQLVQLRNYARAFVEQWMQPTDLAAVWDGGLGGSGEVTISNDKTALIDKIDRAGFWLSSGNAATSMLPQARMRDAVDWLSAVQGRRKALILFSAGMLAGRPYSEINRLVGAPQVRTPFFVGPTENDFTTLVERADVHIYPCDIRGLVAPSLRLAQPSAFGPGSSAGFSNITASTENMKTLAAATGGLAMVNTNDLPRGVRSDRRGQQPVLLAGVRLDVDAEGGRVPFDRCAAQTAGTHGPRTQGLRRPIGVS